MDKDRQSTEIPFKIEIPVEELQKPRAGGDTIYWSSAYAGSSSDDKYNVRIGIQWSSTTTTGGSNVYARTILGSARISASNKTATITINGVTKEGTFDPSSSGVQTKTAVENTVKVSYYGSKSITISGTIALNITYSGTKVNTMSHSVTAALDTVPVPAPADFSLSGYFAKGATHTVTYTPVSGINYQLMISKYVNGAWTGWKPYNDSAVSGGLSVSSSSGKYVITYGANSPNNTQYIQVGVRAYVGSTYSGVSAGSYGQQIRRTIRAFIDGAWRYAYPKRASDGKAGWARVHNGSSWIIP